nr:ethanolamine ammonia-lyase subunit EutB [Candidatus Frankia alpina]
MAYRATLRGERHVFADLATLFAKANEEKSGDQLAGIAATSARERVGGEAGAGRGDARRNRRRAADRRRGHRPDPARSGHRVVRPPGVADRRGVP